jgi:hypothetical protein
MRERAHDPLGGWPTMKPSDRRKSTRIDFSHAVSAQIIAIDGTWQRPCKISDVSETGANILVDGSIEKLQIKEFFLLLSKTGPAYRRCELAWVNGSSLGARFIKNVPVRRSMPKTSGLFA